MRLTGYVLDPTAMLGYAAGHTPYRGLVHAALEDMVTLALPAAALVAAWAQASPAQQDALQKLIDFPIATVDRLGLTESIGVGLMLAQAPAATAVAAGHVVWSARRRAWPIITSDPKTVTSVDPSVPTLEP